MMWMKRVDAELLRACGLVAMDLVDAPYRDAFEAGKTPKAMARKVVKMNGGAE